MTSPDGIGFRRLEKWVRTWSRKKDCEFVGILRGLPYLTSFNNIMLWFACNLFTGYKDNYAKQAEEVDQWKSWTTTLLCYIMLFYDPISFPKKTFPTERNEAK